MIVEASIHEAYKLDGQQNPKVSMILILSPKEEQANNEFAGTSASKTAIAFH